MLSLLLLAIFTQQPGDAEPSVERRALLTEEDALWSFEGVSGPVQVVNGLRDAGTVDLVLERAGDRTRPQLSSRIEAVALKSGERIRTLWTFDQGGDWWWMERSARKRQRWDAQGDANGDSCSDLIVGNWRDGTTRERCGEVVVVSGKDASVLHKTEGDDALDGYGYSVTFIGDVNGDGHDDYAVGAPQAKAEEVVLDRTNVVSETMRFDGSGPEYEFEDGTTRTVASYAQERLDKRSKQPGYVSVRSGLDGKELVRFMGERAGHGFGTRVCAIGDIDGDGVRELCIAPANESETEVQVVSVKKGEVLARFTNTGGPLVSVGDVDGDGVSDLSQANLDYNRRRYHTSVQLLSGATRRALFELRLPDWASKYAVSTGVGDIDGDGHVDIAIGDADFALRGPGSAKGMSLETLRSMSLKDVLAIPTNPRLSGWDSGCVWVYSGATQEVILGIYGAPGVERGLGLGVAALPDVNGNGRPNLLVTDESSVFVY